MPIFTEERNLHMKCPICGKDVVIKNKQVGVNEQGNPVFNQYAVCKDCKKQWNLDKKRASKATSKKTTEKPEDGKEVSAKQNTVKKEAPVKQNTVKKETPVKQNAVKKEAPVKQSTVKKETSIKTTSPEKEAIKRTATPGQKPRKKSEHTSTSKQTTTVPNSDVQKTEKKASTKQHPAKKADHKPEAKRNTTKSDVSRTKTITKVASSKKEDIDNPKLKNTIILDDDDLKLGNIPSEKVREKRERKVKQGYAEMVAADSKNTAKSTEKKQTNMSDSYDDYEPIVRFRALRVIFGIISILIAGFYAYNSYTADLFNSTTGMTFLILAGCMALAGLLLIILNATNNIFAFLLPMILYLASGLYAFLNRGDDTFLLYSAIVGAAFSVLFIILAISSRGDEEDYDDFDDDSEEDEEDDWDDEEDDF